MIDKTDEILEALERVVILLKRENGRKRGQAHRRKTERNEEMRRHRFDEGWTLQKIATKYGISRERVRQLVGNTGYISVPRTEERNKYICSRIDKTNGELSEELNLHPLYISQIRSHTRHAIETGNPSVQTGIEWEEWAHKYLKENNIENELQPHGAPYDIIALGNVFIDVKVATKTHKTSPFVRSPQYKFQPNTRHNKADIYMLIIAPSEDVFIVPASKIENMVSVSFCWPSKRPEIGKIQKYYKRLDLIRKVHESKVEA